MNEDLTLAHKIVNDANWIYVMNSNISDVTYGIGKACWSNVIEQLGTRKFRLEQGDGGGERSQGGEEFLKEAHRLASLLYEAAATTNRQGCI